MGGKRGAGGGRIPSEACKHGYIHSSIENTNIDLSSIFIQYIYVYMNISYIPYHCGGRIKDTANTNTKILGKS